MFFPSVPSDKSLGYFQMSLRDADTPVFMQKPLTFFRFMITFYPTDECELRVASSAAPEPGDVPEDVEDKANVCRKAPANYRIIFIKELPQSCYGYVYAKLVV